MKLDKVEEIARAVLYEGYLLYPYRPSVKNRQRWTFGGLYPPAWSEAHAGSDGSVMQTQCLALAPPKAQLDVTARFLQIVARTVGQVEPPVNASTPIEDVNFREVQSLEVAGKLYQTWEEAVERKVAVGRLDVERLAAHLRRTEFASPPAQELEPLQDEAGHIAGVLVRDREGLQGAVETSAERLTAHGDGDLFRITVRAVNATPFADAANQPRPQAVLRSLASTHVILGIEGGQFLSLTDPPERWRAHAEACKNIGAWPALVGEVGDTDTMLSSPIILYDYPQIAPESPGDLFDATEIDEILTLRIMTMTEDEKRAMCATDERARALLERTASLARQQLLDLHGTFRGLEPLAKAQTHE